MTVIVTVIIVHILMTEVASTKMTEERKSLLMIMRSIVLLNPEVLRVTILTWKRNHGAVVKWSQMLIGEGLIHVQLK